MDHQASKRPLDDAAENSAADAPPTKKQKPASSECAAALQQLDNGLRFLEHAHGYSEQAKRLAQELRNLLESHANNSNDSQSSPEPTVPSRKKSHTDVPPPIQPKVPAYNGPPAPALQADSQGMPPLPPITDLTLLTAPFTHTSTLPAYVPATSTNTYEPLEFLGDAYIELIATRLIHERLPDYNVGQKSSLREQLVKNETLAQYSRAYNFADRIKVSGNELQATKASIKILADVFEAYVACIILSDGERGFSIAEEWLARVWEPKIHEWLKSGSGKTFMEPESLSMDIKSDLQKYLVSKGVKLEYVEDRPMELIKDGNKTTFYVSVYLTGWGYNKVRLGSGTGRNKQIAGAEAAKNAFLHGRAIVEDAHKKKLDHDRINQMQRRQSHMNPRAGGGLNGGAGNINISNWQVSSN